MHTEKSAAVKAGGLRPVASDGRLNRESLLANLALTLPFVLLYWANLYHHTLFFDEINAWAIAANSPDLSTLFRLVHFEGHPWLWYFLLWLPSRFTHDPQAMLWVVAPAGTASYLLLGLVAPFTRLQKLLLFLSYFVVFEYTVMNRMYCIMFLLALLYVWRRCRKPDGVIGNVLLLAIMTNVDMTGVLLSGALLLEYVFACWQAARSPGSSGYAYSRWLPAVGLYIALLALSVHSLLPAPDISWQSSGQLGSKALSLRYISRSITNVTAAPWWPISHEFPRRFWETDVRDQKLLVVLVPFVLAAQWWTLRRNRNLLLLMGLTLSFAILFADIVYVGRVRHWGITFITLLVALWMQNDGQQKRQLPQPRAWPMTAYALMGLSAVSGVVATGSSWTHPFSQAKATAAWLRQNNLQGPTLIGAPDVSFASIGEELQQPVYFMECGCFDTFKLFSRYRENFLETEIPDRLVKAQQDLKSDSLLFAFYRPLRTDELQALASRSMTAALVKEFPGADTFGESFYLYRVVKS